MNSTPRLMHSLLLGAVILALASASGGCSWIKKKSGYTTSVESRPIEVPPDLDLPDTSAATAMPPSSGSGTGQASANGDVLLSVSATAAYPRIGKALEGIEGVTINGRAEALGSFDVTYQGQSFLIRVLDTQAGGSRLVALSADGHMLNSGPAGDLLAVLVKKL